MSDAQRGGRARGQRLSRRLERLLEITRLPGGLGACFRRPPSLNSQRLLLGLRQAAPDIKTVIDGGANVGQFARAAAETYPEASVYAFEPLPAAAAQFSRNLADRPRVKLIESALASRDGTTIFYPNQYSQSSSALPQAAAHTRSFSQDKQLAPIRVPSITLDTFASGKVLRAPILIKLDLQGYELEALKGGTELLRKTDFVLAETVFEPMYEGEPLFVDILGFLSGAGFAFRMPLAFMRDERGLIVQMDALFFRRQ
ncbi:MAG: FkbM family methyltransferase [Limisphaerales bacterium]